MVISPTSSGRSQSQSQLSSRGGEKDSTSFSTQSPFEGGVDREG